MQIRTQQSLLKTAASRLHGTISDRTLSHISIKADSTDGLMMTASDRVLSVYTRIDAVIEKPGTLFVPGKIFLDLVRELPEGEISLKQQGQYLAVTTTGDSEFSMRIPLIQDLEWVDSPRFSSNRFASVKSDRLRYMISQIQFCIAQDSPRAYGTVAYIHKPKKNVLRFVGTDGFRLSYCDTDGDWPDNFLEQGVCLSKRAVSELNRMASEGFDDIKLEFSDDATLLQVEVHDYTIYIRLSAVKFPNYQGVLPTANLNLVKVSRPQLQMVMRRVLLAADKSRALQLSFSDSSLTLSSRTQGSSEGKERIHIDGQKGGESQLYVNGRFLADVFGAISSEELTLQFKSDEDPIVVVPDSEIEHCKSMHVLVPIRDQS